MAISLFRITPSSAIANYTVMVSIESEHVLAPHDFRCSSGNQCMALRRQTLEFAFAPCKITSNMEPC